VCVWVGVRCGGRGVFEAQGEGGTGMNMKLMRAKYCSLNIKGSHNFLLNISIFLILRM
jgi:hypothetical protein